ncbi:hypothetical protein HMI54_003634 [Coelomomyces lativittatus]|nr:hypothetical protein HMI54_003634 [Coelomomyces lativittatus]KAJ1508736.1 hypothetical protein HMI56_007131 [Coelomomyces lativittatus]KAJ1517440.1 hypothetical protein HMI55_007059 [Coelomomyces lativittatus]
MSDWDSDSSETPQTLIIPIQPISMWEEEEEEGNAIKDSWDVLSDEENSTEPVPPPIEPKSNTPSPKLAPKKLTVENVTQNDASDRSETLTQKKLRLQRVVIQSDEKNINDLFGNLSLEQTTSLPENNVSLPPIDSFPSDMKVTKEFLEDFSAKLMNQFLHFENHSYYVFFLETLVKNLFSRLQVEDIRKMSSVLNILANEMQRKERDSSKKKKAPTKKQVKVTASVYEDEDPGDFDDFM